MPFTSSPANNPAPDHAPDTRRHADRRRRVERLDRLATTLDSKFTIPGLRIPVGWDSILGLIPGVGDVITAGPGAVMIYEAHRMGARKRKMVRMGVNTGVDMLLGSIPLIGDLFDLAFKSHRRNVEILKAELARIEDKEATQTERNTQWQNARDPRMEAATRTRHSEKRAPSTSRDGPAAHSSATSPHKMN